MIRRGSTSVDSSSSSKSRYAYQRVEELKIIEGGAVSYAPTPTPEPSTTSHTGLGGKLSYVRTLDREPGAGHWPEVCRKADGRTTGDHALLEVDGQLKKTDGEEAIGGEREDAVKLHRKAKNLGESWRGG